MKDNMKNKYHTYVKNGKIINFDEKYGCGEIIIDMKRIKFSSINFRSERPLRAPKIGESVNVIFNDLNELISVRSIN